MTGIDPAEWLNIRQAYSRIGVSYSSFYNAMYRNEGGRTPYFIHGGRKYFLAHELDKWFKTYGSPFKRKKS